MRVPNPRLTGPKPKPAPRPKFKTPMVPGSAVNPKPRVGGATPKPAPKPKRGAVPQLPQKNKKMGKRVSIGAATTNYKDLISLTPAPRSMAKGNMTKKKGK